MRQKKIVAFESRFSSDGMLHIAYTNEEEYIKHLMERHGAGKEKELICLLGQAIKESIDNYVDI